MALVFMTKRVQLSATALKTLICKVNNIYYLVTKAPVSGVGYGTGSEHLVTEVALEARKMGKHKDLCDFDEGQIVMVRPPGQSISITTGLVGCFHHAVVTNYLKWSKEGQLVKQQQGHGHPVSSEG